jgi:uncharacterized membrane protein YkoI
MQFKPVILISLICGIAGVASADDQSNPTVLSKTPAAVQKAIQAQSAGGTLGEIDKTPEDEDMAYDVELTAKDGQERDFSVAEDGTLLSVEVALAETPAAAQKTIQTELNGGDLESIDKNLDDSEITYDIEGTANDGKEKDFTIADDGTILSEEVVLAETPNAVQKAIASQLNGGKLESIDENFDDDGNNFDVEWTAKDGQEKSFNVAADGNLASEEVALEEVPRPAQRTIKNQIGAGKILRIDKSLAKEKRGSPYEVEGRKDGKPFDFSVGPRGRFLGMDD